MFTTLRNKLLLGLTPLLAIMVGLGLWAVAMLDHLGGRIDVILRENYVSVIAAEDMKESLERLDSAALFALAGEEDQAIAQAREARPRFAKALDSERRNVTLIAGGEQELADRLAESYAAYLKVEEEFFALPAAEVSARKRIYFGRLLPRFVQIKNAADEVLRINQANMKAEDRKAIEAAGRSKRVMALALLAAAAVASLIAFLLSRSILEPIRAVTRGARALAKGNLDQVVPVLTRDELGELAAAFNAMARTIREFQQAGTARLVRAQQTAQATIDSFPDPVVVVDPTGAVERANPAARRILGVIPGDGTIPWTPPPMLKGPLTDVLGGRDDYLPTGVEHAICFRDDGQERFYLPRVLSIRGDDGVFGAAVAMQDVTKFRLVDQLKSDMVSTVSHELKTPLTGLQMAVHLLLEESVGPLNAKQIELMLAARQDSDRLLAMVNDLLDLTRIEQGRVRLDLRPVGSADLVSEAIRRFEAHARDAGVELSGTADPGLPPVQVDRERFAHVFDNLLGNALGHTRRGGAVRLTAGAADHAVTFVVDDTGEGIPAEHLPRLFEKFYRVPGSRSAGGAGLGLAIAREIVEAHGGQIEVRSEVGRGTTFTVRLPESPADGGSARDGASLS